MKTSAAKNKQIYGYQRGNMGGGHKLGVWDKSTQDTQSQGPIVQRRELYLLFRKKPVWEKNLQKNGYRYNRFTLLKTWN